MLPRGSFYQVQCDCVPVSHYEVLVSGGSGLLDPCEKGGVDAASSLTAQERVDITVSAQVSPGHRVSTHVIFLFLLACS